MRSDVCKPGAEMLSTGEAGARSVIALAISGDVVSMKARTEFSAGWRVGPQSCRGCRRI